MVRLTFLLALLVAACVQTMPPVRESNTNNTEAVVDELFTHAGCTVYRFVDNNRYHYFAKCAGSTSTETTRVEHCGRGCVNTVSDVIAVQISPKDSL